MLDKIQLFIKTSSRTNSTKCTIRLITTIDKGKWTIISNEIKKQVIFYIALCLLRQRCQCSFSYYLCMRKSMKSQNCDVCCASAFSKYVVVPSRRISSSPRCNECRHFRNRAHHTILLSQIGPTQCTCLVCSCSCISIFSIS